MKKVAVALMAMLILVCVHSVFAGREHTDLQKDDRRTLPSRPNILHSPSSPSITPPFPPPGSDPWVSQWRNRYDQALAPVEKKAQDLSRNITMPQDQRKAAQQTIDQERKAISDRFQKEYFSHYGIPYPSAGPGSPSISKTPPSASPQVPGSSPPIQMPSTSRESSPEWRSLQKDFTDQWNALIRQQGEVRSNPKLSSDQKAKLEDNLRIQKNVLSELWQKSAQLSNWSSKPDPWLEKYVKEHQKALEAIDKKYRNWLNLYSYFVGLPESHVINDWRQKQIQRREDYFKTEWQQYLATGTPRPLSPPPLDKTPKIQPPQDKPKTWVQELMDEARYTMSGAWLYWQDFWNWLESRSFRGPSRFRFCRGDNSARAEPQLPG